MNPAPPKPPLDTTDYKAVSAWHSELRRWAKALTRWEARLDEREIELAKAVEEYESSYVQENKQSEEGPLDDEDCGCTTEDAKAGCDCPPCVVWRSRRAQGMNERQQEAVKVGDEVQWLEDLWKLRDRRRKRQKK